MADLTEDKIKALTTERASLRYYVKTLYGNFSMGIKIDADVLNAKATRLAELQEQLGPLTEKKDPTLAEKDLEKHLEVSGIIALMVQAPKQSLSKIKPLEVKLPKVKEDDAASWFNFRSMLERLSITVGISDEDKHHQMMSALPSEVAALVRKLPFQEAMDKVIEELETPESLIDMVRTRFRDVPSVDNPLDLSKMRTLVKAVRAVLALSAEEKVNKEALKLASQRLPKLSVLTFTENYSDFTLENMYGFLKDRVKGLEFIDEFCGANKPTTKPKAEEATSSTTKLVEKKKEGDGFKNKRKFKQKSTKTVTTVNSDESDSSVSTKPNKAFGKYSESSSDDDDSEDEIIINGKVNGKPVKMLIDTGSKKSMLPAELFPPSNMKT